MKEEDSKIDLNEYEWGLEPLSNASIEENPKEPNDTIDEAQEIAHMKLQWELDEIRLKRQEAYEQQLRGEKEQEDRLPIVSPSNEIKQIRYGNTAEELEARQARPIISPEEVEWERR